MTSRSRLADAANRGVAPEFVVPLELLDAVSPSGAGGGIVLGSGPQGEPLAVSVLRPDPTRVALVGGLYLARQVVLRAVATGAWVVVATGRPTEWQSLAAAAGTVPAAGAVPASGSGLAASTVPAGSTERATGPGLAASPAQDRAAVPLVRIRRLAPVQLPPASEDAPLLVVHDGGAVPQELFPPRSAWQTTMYVLPYLHPQAAGIAGSADLVLLQRLPAGQAELAARIWRLAPPMLQQLGSLNDDGLVIFGQNVWLPMGLLTTQREQEILGPPRRGD